LGGGRHLAKRSHGDGPPRLERASKDLMSKRQAAISRGREGRERRRGALGDPAQRPARRALAHAAEESPEPDSACPATQRCPRGSGRGANLGPGAHLAAHLRGGLPRHTEKRQRPGDGRRRVEPAPQQLERPDDEDGPAVDAAVAADRHAPDQGWLPWPRGSPHLSLSQAVSLDHHSLTGRAAGSPAAGALSGSRLLDQRRMLHPALDLQRKVDKSLVAPFLSQLLSYGARRGGCTNTPAPPSRSRPHRRCAPPPFGAASTSSRVNREDQAAMAIDALPTPLASNSRDDLFGRSINLIAP